MLWLAVSFVRRIYRRYAGSMRKNEKTYWLVIVFLFITVS